MLDSRRKSKSNKPTSNPYFLSQSSRIFSTQLLINDESDTESEVDPDTNDSSMSIEDLGQTLDPCLMEGPLRYIEEEAGPPPDMESCMCLEHRIATQTIVVVLTYHFKAPISYEDNIRHHDEWYMSIMNAICFHADNTPSDEVHGSIYSRAILYWLKANPGEKSRNLISVFLLHPHIRSVRCRAVMGCHDWGQVFEELEFFPLSSSGKGIPEVLGTYALSARTTDTQQEFAYGGQSAATKATEQRARGIRGRSQAHWAEFLSARAHKNDSSPPRQRSRLFLFKELADSKVEQINLSVLSTFPWPTLEMGYIVAHFPFLLTLAETIDIVYLDTFVWKIHLDLAGNARNPMTGLTSNSPISDIFSI